MLPVTEQLLADANINLVQFIIELFAEAIGLAEDKAFFTGSGQPRGIAIESISQINAQGHGDFDDVIDLIDAVPSRVTSSPGAAFVGHRRTKSLLRKLKDNDGNYIWRNGGASKNNNGETVRLPDTLYDYPFFEQNDLPSNQLFFGDWRMYIIGDRQTMAVAKKSEGNRRTTMGYLLMCYT